MSFLRALEPIVLATLSTLPEDSSEGATPVCLPALNNAIRLLLLNSDPDSATYTVALEALWGVIARHSAKHPGNLRAPALGPCSCSCDGSPVVANLHYRVSQRVALIQTSPDPQPFFWHPIADAEAEFIWAVCASLGGNLENYLRDVFKPHTKGERLNNGKFFRKLAFGGTASGSYARKTFDEVFQTHVIPAVRTGSAQTGYYFRLLAALALCDSVRVQGVIGAPHYAAAIQCLMALGRQGDAVAKMVGRELDVRRARIALVYEPLMGVCMFLKNTLSRSLADRQQEPADYLQSQIRVFRALPGAVHHDFSRALAALTAHIPQDVTGKWLGVCNTLAIVSGGRFDGVPRGRLEGFDAETPVQQVYSALLSLLQAWARPQCANLTECRQVYAPGRMPRCLDCHLVVYCNAECATAARSARHFPHAHRCKAIRKVGRALFQDQGPIHPALWDSVLADAERFVGHCVAKGLDLNVAREAVHALLLQPGAAAPFV
ncbi:hypothetical protein MKEN_00940800 [Mycena kentingensis (nom. inval.)]|nr:hypothetical protein MKEN_00940800 [Mycena kentingensis (nom. inval.)]